MKPHKFSFLVVFDESGALPTEINVIPVGEWEHPSYGHMKISELDLAEFVRNFDAGIRKDLPIKEGHEVMDEKPAIGWFKKLINKGSEGLWATVEWTEKGKELLSQKAYKYFSPEFYQTYEDPESRRVYNNVLVGGALTNSPYFKELEPVMFSEPKILNQFTMHELDKIRVKAMSELTDDEKSFLKEHKADLTQEEAAKFSEVLGDEESPADDEEGEDEEAGEEGGEKVDASEKGKKKPIKATEKMEMVSASELALLREKADQGAEAHTKIRKMEFASEVSSLVFNDSTKKGKILPKSKDKVVSFMMLLDKTQLQAFREIVKELPESLSFSEVGDAGNTKVTSATEIDTLITEKRKADPKLTYSEALKRVFKENPTLADKHNNEVDPGSNDSE